MDDTCAMCGKGMRMRYLGSDPENGPAMWDCVDDHRRKRMFRDVYDPRVRPSMIARRRRMRRIKNAVHVRFVR